ncbi:uncharacterized protein [Dysidea avara]|uniref:uncharacterized protein isoform X2 n=1 Tax=Dysidea avara TaxID=196820 RepID=UPI003321AB44
MASSKEGHLGCNGEEVPSTPQDVTEDHNITNSIASTRDTSLAVCTQFGQGPYKGQKSCGLRRRSSYMTPQYSSNPNLPRHNDTILSTPQDATDIPNSAHPVHVADTRDLSQRLGSEALQYGRGQDNGQFQQAFSNQFQPSPGTISSKSYSRPVQTRNDEPQRSHPVSGRHLTLKAGPPACEHYSSPATSSSDHFSVAAVDDNDENEPIGYKTPIDHRKIDYYRYIEDQHIDPSIVESGELPQYIINTKEESNKKLQNEVSILKQRLDDSNCETEKLQQRINDYEQINKDQAMQLCLQAQNKLGTSAERYPMDKHPHGLAVLVINSNFHSRNAAKRTLPDRNGSLVDEDNLCMLWMYLQYEVIKLKNLTALELVSELRKISQLDHGEYDSFVLCISSHGCPDGVYGVDGEPVHVDEITKLFTIKFCPTLMNKPKLLFIQGCCISPSALSEVDFLVGFATPSGQFSYRNPKNGSYYICRLCEVFKANVIQKDLVHMLNNVCDEMSVTRTTDGHQLCAEVITTLRKDVWFFQSTLCKRNAVVAPVCNAQIRLILVLCVIILLLCIFLYFLYILLHRYVQKSCDKL